MEDRRGGYTGWRTEEVDTEVGGQKRWIHRLEDRRGGYTGWRTEEVDTQVGG